MLYKLQVIVVMKKNIMKQLGALGGGGMGDMGGMEDLMGGMGGGKGGGPKLPF